MKLEFKPINIDGKIKEYRQSTLQDFLENNRKINSLLIVNCTEEIILSMLTNSFEKNLGISILQTNNFTSELNNNILRFGFQFILVPENELKKINFNKYIILFQKTIDDIEYFLIELTEIKYPLEFTKSILLFTSGSSGVRKVVKISHRAILSCAKFMSEKMAMSYKDCELIYAQLDHAFCLGRILSCGLVKTPFCFLNSSQMLKPSSIEKMINLQHLTGLSTMPSVLFSILSIKRYSLEFSHKLRYIQMGGMFLPAERKKFILNKLPNTKIFVNYGMTEYMRATFYDISEFPNKLNTEGCPAKDTEIKISQINNNEISSELENKNIGEILIKGAHLCDGYINKTEWGKRITEDGFFKTGDLGYLDNDGFLVHQGRKDKTFNYQGKLFNSDDLCETFLEKYPDFKDKITIIPLRKENSLKDYEVYLCVIKDDFSSIKKEEQAFIKKFFITLGLSVSIKYFEREFPRTQNGKISYGEIKKILLDKKKNN